jgi:hypothetical protein
MKIWLFTLSFLFPLFCSSANFPSSGKLVYKLSFEDQYLGTVNVDFKSDKNSYEIAATSNFFGMMKLVGDYQIVSQGKKIMNNYLPLKITRKNLKKNKITTTSIDYKNKLIQIERKNKVKEYQLKENTQDIVSYFFELNSKKEIPKEIKFTILDSYDYNEYVYTKIQDEKLQVGKKIIDVSKYQGRINGDDNIHHIWISKKNFHIPVKIVTPTPIGIIVTQELIKGKLLDNI